MAAAIVGLVSLGVQVLGLLAAMQTRIVGDGGGFVVLKTQMVAIPAALVGLLLSIGGRLWLGRFDHRLVLGLLTSVAALIPLALFVGPFRPLWLFVLFPGLVILVAVAELLYLWRERSISKPANRFQFRLRAMFLLTAAVALLTWSAVTFQFSLAAALYAGAFIAVSVIVIVIALQALSRL
jgi:hypothetical protein